VFGDVSFCLFKFRTAEIVLCWDAFFNRHAVFITSNIIAMDFRIGIPHRSEDDTQMNVSLILFAKDPRAQETRSNSLHRQHLTSFWARVQTKHPGKGKVMLRPSFGHGLTKYLL
jgi:hypothetical protein